MNLLIVESPKKSRTLSQFLNKDFKIAATVGHIRDLPRRKLGVDIKNEFKPTYKAIPNKQKVIKELKKQSKKAKQVVLAMDPDREGEAIAWHTAKALNLGKNYQRIAFHEITKSAVEKALKNPRKIDMNLVNAQQARRILDRIVGYKLSPLLWRKIAKGLSAGRVQSVALRLIVEREKEIKAFVKKEYWTIEALLQKVKNGEFKALLIQKGKKKLGKFAIKNKEQAEKIVKDLDDTEYKVKNIERKQRKRSPLAPFKTSTLQQESWQRFKFPAKMTMGIAQALYEKGLITYHRTDSTNLSQEALEKAKNIILDKWGKNYLPGASRQFKTKAKVAQEAHEAIRPSYPEKTPEKLKSNLEEVQFKLYDLIWRRFIACQMKEAVFDATIVDILAKAYAFRATGQILKFDGFLKVYPMRYEEAELPELKKNEMLKLKKLIPEQHFTQPPPRYTEASLIKELEKNGVGRPSTYASIISVIQERNYIKKNEKKQFYPEEIGITVSDLLVEHFPKIVDINFTAKMEENLDKIANGKKEWTNTLENFYKPFAKNLNKKYKEIEKKVETTEKKCPKCGSPLVVRMSRFGKFYGCSNYPKCKFTQPFDAKTFGPCPKCKKGEIVEKKTKKGKTFWGCNLWPKCDYATWDEPANNPKKK
jgi:DNA topoisomerase-1